MRVRYKNCIVFLSLLLLPAASLLASTESYIQTLSGKIKKGDSCVVYDDKFLNMPLAEWNQVKHLSVTNLITFELRRDTAFYYQARPFTCTLNISIKYFTSRDQSNPDEINNIDLAVRYDTGTGKIYPLSDSYTKLKNAFKVIVVVNSITSKEWGKDLPPIFRISNQILVERKYPFNRDEAPRLIAGNAFGPAFDYNNAGIPVLAVNAGPNESFNQWAWNASAFDIATPAPNSYNQFPISWAQVGGVDEYDVEWTFVDLMSDRGQQIYNNAAWYNKTANTLLYIPETTEAPWMRNNSTRVTVKGMYTYYIDLPYPEGFVLCRVRGVSYAASGLRQTTPWTYTYTNNSNTFTYGAYINAHQPLLNWQYTASFAEEGKRKEVVSYFDGSLRSRQAVTITNNSADHSSARNNAVVAETIYDKMGRPSMNILPAPVTDIQLKYYLSINKNMAGATYSRDDISLLSTNTDKTCNIGAGPMNTQSGASAYYSPNNPFLPNTTDYFFAKYIPDAGGYPFSVTEYTADNTGRIRRQGGVGLTFQPGNGHDTKYYYGKPNGPRDLLRLFGAEVGDVSHYEKNMVIDPNGQASVSYIDANGKTIATALAGPAPQNLDALPSSSTTQARTTFNQLLVQPTDFTIDAGGLYKSAASTFMAAYPGSYTLHYSVNPATAVSTSPAGSGSFCSNCYYDISITVTDNCGNPVLPATAITPPFPGSDIGCYSNRPPATGDLVVPIQTIGEYTVTYILKLSEKEINYQTDYYVANNSSLYTIQYFFESELGKVDLSGCYNECSTCLAKLGSLPDFTARMQSLLQQQKAEKYPNLPENLFNYNSTYIQNWITTTYNNLLANCQSMQASCTQGSPCEQKKQMMKYDVVPGGQYALYDESALQSNAAQVFLDRTINVPLLNYKSMPEYFTADNGSQVHAVDDNGTLARNLSEADFIRAYQAHLEWADYFVQFHIEYCSYQYCKLSNVEPGYVFDQSLRQVYTTGDKAVARGYYDHNNRYALLNNDPFFNGGGGGANYRSQMSNDLDAYTDALNIKMKDLSGNQLGGKDIISYIDWSLYCQPAAGTTGQPWVNSWQSCSVNAACRSVGREWELYRDFYLQLKSKYVRLAKRDANPGCTDCFIGKDLLTQSACLLPTPSDYQVIYGANGHAPIVYVAYKNETAPFVENYVIQYQATKNGVTTSGTITATQGAMRAYFSFSAPDDVPPTFTITSISCPASASSAVSALANCNTAPPPCPPVSEFVEYHTQENFISDQGYWSRMFDVYIVHNGGPVNRKVTFEVIWDRLNYDGDGEEPRYYSIEAGQDRTWVGTFHEYWSDENADDIEDVNEYHRIQIVPLLETLSCSEGTPVLPSTCATDPRYPYYITKTRIFNEYIEQACYNQMGSPYGVDGSGYSTASLPAMREAANAQVDAMKAGWLSRLQAVRDQEFPAYATTLSDAFLTTFVDKLANVSKAYIATATENNMRPVSTLPAGQNSVDGYNSFEAVFNALVGGTLVHLGFSHHLLDKPYPYDKPNFDADPSLSEIPSGVCSNLTNFYNRWVSLGSPQTFPKWMAQELGDDYTLTDNQLTDLQNKCAASCTHRYLSEGAFIPVALAASANTDHPSLSCARITALQNSFASLYPTVTQADKPELYHLLFTNFVNLSTGYSLAYDEYNTFINNVCPVTSTALLYDKPASPQSKPDDFLCTAGIMKSVFTTAGIEYGRYIEIVRRQFRNSYVSNCLASQASANMTSEQWEYHFTLYYYDQSGNLVKTIPPEGVRLLSNEEIDREEQFKNESSSCPAFPATVLTDKNAILGQLSTALQNNTALSTEMWLFGNAGGSTRQLRMITPDNKYIYQAAISGNKLWVELYTLTASSGSYTITLTNHAAANLVSTIPLQSWTHLLVESAGGVSGGSLQLYLDGYKLTNIPTASIPPYPFPWTIAGGSSLPAEDLGIVKHLRVYNQTLSDAQVLSHYRNSCQGVLSELSGTPLLLWGRFNTPTFCNYVAGAMQTVSTPNKGSLTITGNPVEDYNIVGNVANTFTMEFWVNPVNTEPLTADQLTNIYAGVNQGHHFAIHPTWGGDETSGKAGAGVSVGTDGVAVFEHAGSYMPCLLAWRGTMTGWHHVAVVYTNGTPSLYIDGVYKTTGRATTKSYVSPCYNFGGSNYGFMQGGLDEVRIWNTARSSAEIAANYNKSITPDNQAGLVGYWPMDGTSGAVIGDVTCNHYNANLNTSIESIVTSGASVPQNDYVEYARRVIVPNHGLPTNYVYNSLNQVIKQNTPDAGTVQFWYDRLGRLTVSQNDEQNSPAVAGDPSNRYSYTLYDPLGRISENGEKINIPGGSPAMSEDLARTPASLSSWLGLGNNRKVTVTAYDSKPSWAPAGILQTNLRKRIVATALLSLVSNPAVPTDPSQNRLAASYYSYDLMGNVGTLVQENKAFIGNETQLVHGTDGLTGYKTIKYEYDLLGGKVNKVMYQPGKWDQFNYQYIYDADNRLAKVFTRREDANGDPLTTNNWTQEANYTYYPHGLLARTELGPQVQGLDYAYTLQGWLKGMNGNFLDAASEMSKDGIALGASPFGNFARDAVAFSLGYYSGDYVSVGANLSSNPAGAFKLLYQAPPLNGTASSGKDLFNGNISNATYAIAKLENSATVGYTYRYDQLNRLKAEQRHNISNGSTNWDNNSIIADYGEQITYDANGNITTYQRNGVSGTLPNGAGGGLPMDNLTYGYNMDNNSQLVNNRLRHVKDIVAPGAYQGDIDTQADDNYTYDKIGNLIGDVSEGGMNVKWNVYGKIESIIKPGVSSITYNYDALGHRIGKSVTDLTTSPSSTASTYYVLDGAGNILATYTYKFTGSSTVPTEGSWSEQELYGSRRLGSLNPNVKILPGAPLSSDDYTSNSSIGPLRGVMGLRAYEVTNHLGNVLATISDLAVAIPGSSGQSIDHYEANVLSAQDYYPFGMLMPGRKWDAGIQYRFGFNGKENDREVKGDGAQLDYGMRTYDPRLGRFLRFDLLHKEYNDLSPYHFAGDNPIRNVDLDGGEPKDYVENWMYQTFTKGGKSAYWHFSNDPELGYIDVEVVYDKWTKNQWFIHEAVDGRYYYWKHNPGADQSVRIVSNKPGVSNGEWIEFKTQNRIQYEQTVALTRGLSTFFAAAVAAPFVVGATLELGAMGLNALKEPILQATARAVLTYYKAAPGLIAFGKFGLQLLDESGAATAGMPHEGSANALRFIREIFKDIGKDKNIAYAFGRIGGEIIDLIGVSGQAVRKGTVGNPTTRLFQTFKVVHDRDFDSEVKILEYIANKFKDNTNVTGTIKLVSQFDFCPSCSGVIKQFKEMFPNITIQTVSGINP